MLRIVVIREEEVAPYLAGQQIASLAEEQVFEVIEEEEAIEAGEAADLEPVGEAEQPGEPVE